MDSHRPIHRAGELGGADAQDTVVEALFGAFFTAGRNIGDHGELARIDSAIGLARDETLDYLESAEDTELVLTADEHIRAKGVAGVPCFVIEDNFAVSGAQSPKVFHLIFDLAREASAMEPAPTATAAE